MSFFNEFVNGLKKGVAFSIGGGIALALVGFMFGGLAGVLSLIPIGLTLGLIGAVID